MVCELGEALNKINSSFDTFVQGGSGWTVHTINEGNVGGRQVQKVQGWMHWQEIITPKCKGRESIVVYTEHSYRSVFSLYSCSGFNEGVTQSSTPLII